MRILDSFKTLSAWCNNHYGIIALIFAIFSFGLAFYQNLIGYNQQIILNYKMEKLEAELVEYKNKENQRIEFDAFLGNELKEMKGYVKGRAEGTLTKFINSLPEDYDEFQKLKKEGRKEE